jgi:hypothetical protein
MRIKALQVKVLTGLLVATLGAIVVVAARPEWVVPRVAWLRNGVTTYEMSHGGRADLVEVWRNGHLVLVKQDTRGQGRFDAFTYYENDQPVMFEYDRNYDGVIDYRAVVGRDGTERIEVLRDGVFAEMRANPPETTPQ